MKNPLIYPEVVKREKGIGPGSGGQSGDTQGLPEEAALIDGMEEVSEVRTRQVPEDDVPLEYRNQD